MTHASRHKTGSARLPGGRHVERSDSNAAESNRELRLELRGRLNAVLAELDLEPIDWDVVTSLLAGALEEIEAA
jgi:hypothetical protein